MRTIYVLHRYGEPSHFYALIELANKNGYRVKMYETNIGTQIHGLRKHFDKHQFLRTLRNILILFKLSLTLNQKVVLGLAPYCKTLGILSYCIRNHKIYYFTSHTNWRKPVELKDYDDYYKWYRFIKDRTHHIFAISQKAREQLIDYMNVEPGRISVVNHSLNIKVKPSSSATLTNDFIYSGRLTPEKGVEELLEIFAQHPNLHLTIAGKGELRSVVTDFSNRYENINYVGFIEGFEKLIPVYQHNSYFILNSKATGDWEEFFGISIIEAMACGAVPIAPDHAGPLEIINDGIDGFIFEQDQLSDAIERISRVNNIQYNTMRRNAIHKSRDYQSAVIAERWKAILK